MNLVVGRTFATTRITKEEIVAIMQRNPRLGAYGFGTFAEYHPEFRGDPIAELRESREQLLGSVEQCSNVCEWLLTVVKSKKINRCRTSYGLKHEVEQVYKERCCSNGAFITAAIHMGFDWSECGSAAYFNFDQASLSRLLVTN